MFSVVLKVPCNNVNSIVAVINDEKLDQVLDTCGEDIFDPYVSARCDFKVDCGFCKTTKY
jgi:hypothetical protein